MSFYTFVRTLFKPLISVLWPTKIVNKQNFDEMGGGVVICNHYAIPDTLIPAVKLYKDELHVLAKAEAFENKLGSKFLKGVGAIPVHRGEADIDAVKQVLAVLKADKKLTMYPEGTRNKEGTEQMRQFKQGAARFAIKTKKPILPMVYYRMHKPFQKNWLYIGKPFTLEEFYGDKSPEAYEKATQKVYDEMVKTRQECDAYVLSLSNKKGKKDKAKKA